jgi:formate hydrogenlyase transcriptional activator
VNELTNRTVTKPDVPEEVQARWQRIVDIMAMVLGVSAGLIMKVDPPQIEVFRSSATEGNPYRKGERSNLNSGLYCETVMKRRAPLLVPDALKNPEWDRNPDIKLGMTFYLGYPLSWPDGEIFGTICVLAGKDNSRAVQSRELISEFRQVIERDLRLMIEDCERRDLLAELQRHRDKLTEMVAEQTSELERSKAELEERLKFEDLISGLSWNFVDLPPDAVHIEIIHALKRICVFFGADHCGFFEVLTDLRQIDPVNVSHEEGMQTDPINVVLTSRHPWAYHQLIDAKEPVIFSSLESLPPEANVDRAQWEGEGVQAMLMLPLCIGSRVTHLIGLWSGRLTREWPLAHIRRLNLFGEILAKGLLHLHADKALRRSERGLAEAQRIAHLGSWEWEIDGGNIHLSDEVYRIFGLPPRAFGTTYEAFLASVHPDDRQSVQQAVNESLSDPDKPCSIEHRVIRPDGTERVVHQRGETLFDKDRGPMRMIGTVHDISERKQAEEALKRAFDEIKRLKEQFEAENIYLREEVELKGGARDIVGVSNPIKYVLYRIQQVAPTGATVLLTGETGTGKGIFARALHEGSDRKGKPFVHVNCAGLPANLIESELFGREKGAFTGSTAKQIGRFELADGGTIFLDEIGELPPELQAKLLKVIEDGEFERLGSPHAVKADVRIIASTNRNLEEEIRQGRFRKDLFYRLNVFPLTIPPLRQRREDIPLLVKFYLGTFNKKYAKDIKIIPKNTMNAFENYDWPGNVRELINVVERAVIVSRGSELRLAEKIDALPIDLVQRNGPEGENPRETKGMDEVEREHILRTLQETGWRVQGERGAAQLLGINPSTMRARMRRLGIKRPGKD